MGRVVELNERATISCESISKGVIQKVALVKHYGATPGTNEHFIASTIFTKKVKREMFMTLETLKQWFLWLIKKHEWMVLANKK